MNNRAWRGLAIALVLAAFVEPASAQSSAAPIELSPKAKAVVQAWRGLVDANRALAAALPLAQGVAEELATRVAFEQSVRQPLILINRSRLPPEDMKAAMGEMFRDLEAIDAENTAYLKSVLPTDGWFRNSRDGARVASDAWLIVQHSPDRAFQRQVVAAMEPLVKQGEADAQNYALLYDRTEMSDGRPQRYGTQGTCKDGVWAIHTLEDPTRVDEMRSSMGMAESLAEYSKLNGIGKPC